MTKVEEIKKKLAHLEELERERSNEEQILLRELRKAEKEEKEARCGKYPQFFKVDFGYGGKYYVAATTKEEAIKTLLSHGKDLDEDIVKKRIEALGTQVIYEEDTCGNY
jgi:hypothetical protein